MNFINLKTAFRNLGRNSLLSFLNIVGLGAGLAVAIIIFNYSWQESNADNHHENLDEIYVVKNGNSARVPYEMASLIKEQIPSIKYVSQIESNFIDRYVLSYNDEISVETNVILTDNDFTSIFSFEPVAGSLDDALSEPGSIVLTESESNRIFKEENPIGKTLSLKGKMFFLSESVVQVKAVIKDMPVNSNLQFSSMVSFSTAKKMMPWMDQCIWSCHNVQNYIRLGKDQDPELVAAQMNEILRPLIPERVKIQLSLMEYDNVYFSSIRDEFKHGNIKLIYTLISISVLILAIALINYINLSIAGSTKRLTEVGVKKIVGVRPVQLIRQFIGESVLTSILALLMGLFLARLVTPRINSLSIITLPEVPLTSTGYWLVFIGGAISIGILAGIIPALSFNKFKPISLITKRYKNQGQGMFLKRGLIVFQFVISIALIICTITVTRQLSHVRNSDVGFSSENIINIRLSPEVNSAVFKGKLLQIPGVEGVSLSRWFPGNIEENWSMPLVYNGVEEKVKFACENADANYINLMGLEIVEGRNFSDSLKSDIGSAIINEAAVKEFGLKNPLEAKFNKNGIHRIVGVVKDFNFQSLHNQIKPLVIFHEKEMVFSASVKLAGGNFGTTTETINRIKESWNEVSPGFPIDYKFVDEEVDNLYKSELIFEKIFRSGSAFAIFISCLGLFGLVLGSTEKRRKEIGIRKVNGAKIGEIIMMLNKDFIKWILFAFVIATPVSWYLMTNWLQNFAYKISLSWWIFALAGFLALGIALLTVSWQSWRAATSNPVDALRYE